MTTAVLSLRARVPARPAASLRLALLVALVAGLAPVAGPVTVAYAADTFTVTSATDAPDASPGDGICEATARFGDCSLRAAIMEANARPLTAGPATIVLPASSVHTLSVAGAGEDSAARGDLDIRRSLNLTVASGGSARVTVASGWDDRILDVHALATAHVTGVTFARFRSQPCLQSGGVVLNRGTLTLRAGAGVLAQVSGGCAGEGGGIYNAGTLTLSGSATVGNVASGEGGGIYNAGTLTLSGSLISQNQATNGSGGGIRSHGPLTVSQSRIVDNDADDGGGVYVFAGGALTLSGSTIRENTARRFGGGIFASGALTVSGSAVHANTAGLEGGGIFHLSFGEASPYPAPLALSASTLSANTARNGGGLASDANGTSATLTNVTVSGNVAKHAGGGVVHFDALSLNNVTITANTADGDGDGLGDGGGIWNADAGARAVLSAANTIVAGNVDLRPGTTAQRHDCSGGLVSRGFNLIQHVAGCFVTGDTTGNVTGRSALVGPLQDNGGATFTHALFQGSTKSPPSPALDAGSPAAPGSGGSACASRDQRGIARPQDGNADGVARCDIGAFELVPSFTLGTFALAPAEAGVRVGQRLTYTFAWDVPPPRGWRSLDTLHLRLRDDEGAILWVRFQEVGSAPGTFSLVNPEMEKVGPAFAPGSPNRLETAAATLSLAGSAVDGPPGPRVTLTLELGFKPQAAGRGGRTYDVEVLAIDDTGTTQGFHRAGTLTVLPARP